MRCSGSSGCGKTTLLNIISGLVRPSQGRVLFGDRDVTDAATAERNIAQVFQFPVVYDTMTVRDNLAFPLRNRGMDAAYVKARVNQIAAMIGMEATLDRKAHGLTADAKQKISLGRGMVREDVNAILFDEPLTVIDPHMKWELRTQLKSLHREFGHTMIYVTHDQTEALTFADKVVVMYDGRVVQMGTPQELFETPAHTFVGYFIGSPGMNLLDAEVTGDRAHGRRRQLAAGRRLRPAQRPHPDRHPPRIRPPDLRRGPARHHPPGRGRRPPPHRPRRLPGPRLNAIAPGGRRDLRRPDPARLPPDRINVYADDWRVDTAGKGRLMEKTENQKAWFLVLPVLVLVAFSAVIPLMTVVNYSVQDTFGNNEFFWAGLDWFDEMVHSDRLWAAFWRQMLFSAIILAIEVPLGIFIALNMPKSGFWASVCLVLMSLPLLIPFNVVGTIWQIFGRVDIGLLGHTLAALGIDYNYTSNVARRLDHHHRDGRLALDQPRRAAVLRRACNPSRRPITRPPRSTRPAAGRSSATSSCRRCTACC